MGNRAHAARRASGDGHHRHARLLGALKRLAIALGEDFARAQQRSV
jgi:hypothetical protein